ncbi:MAG: ABC transporter ATP-binding protein [Eubacteriaceae bacterium]|nr:ABC transporter ATP-binding protein [Eubacteriaceae bacterium]
MELTIDSVTKRFKEKVAVKEVSLEITPGVWGLLGANGAGKTTLMRMAAGIMKPDGGQIRCEGIPINVLKEKYREIFGYLPQEFGFYPEFTAIDYLEYMAGLKGLTRRAAKVKIEELLERFSLTQAAKMKISKMSGGTKRRVGIAQALLNDPKILIMDEPTGGLDPGERVRFRNLLSEASRDRIVLISTHIVSDVEYIASRIAVMKQGSLIALGSTPELVQMARGKVYTCLVPQDKLAEYERKLNIVNLRNEQEGKVSLRYLSQSPLTEDSQADEPRLEDLYLYLFPNETKEAE